MYLFSGGLANTLGLHWLGFSGDFAWSPADNNYNHFLTFDLGSRQMVVSIATKGRSYTSEFVTEYIVQYSDDGYGWKSFVSATGEIEV